MRCSEPGVSVAVAIAASRVPGAELLSLGRNFAPMGSVEQKSMKTLVGICLLATMHVVSCLGADEWLYGTWHFDIASTYRMARTNSQSTTHPGAAAFYDVTLVLDQLDGARYSFTGTNFTASTKVQTNVIPYTLLQRRGSNEVVVLERGVTNTIRRVATGLEIKPRFGFWLYFTRSPQ